MTRRRFYVPRDSIRNATAYLPPDQSHHLRDVLRIESGETVEVLDGEGAGYVGEVAFEDSVVVVRRLQPLPCLQTRAPIILAAALIKPSKFEWVLQKSTELGVHEIIPVKTRRSDVRIPLNKVDSRCERWKRIVTEASKQCGRFSAPRIHPPLDFSDMLHREEFSDFEKIMFYENAREFWRPDAGTLSRRIVLCVGPAGGWDNDEIEEAGKAGFDVFSLGRLVLRAETAAIAAVSIVQYHINLQSTDDSRG